jgi:hypothetical protein
MWQPKSACRNWVIPKYLGPSTNPGATTNRFKQAHFPPVAVNCLSYQTELKRRLWAILRWTVGRFLDDLADIESIAARWNRLSMPRGGNPL